MGNVCGCCLKSDQDGSEPPPVETVELLHSRARPVDREVRSYDSILENANSTFLVFKAKGKPAGESGAQRSVSAIRARLSEAIVAPLAQSPPTTISGRDLWSTSSSGQQPGPVAGQQHQPAAAAEPAMQAIAGAIHSSVSYQQAYSSVPPIVTFKVSAEDDSQA